MAGAELREARIAVHAKIDPLWKSGRLRRGEVYRIITLKLGHTYHTGESDLDTCNKILAMEIAYED